MSVRPSIVPVLDTNLTNRAIPAAGKITDGYVLNDIFPESNANYLHGYAGDWLTWLDERTADGATPISDLTFNAIAGTGAGAGGISSFIGGVGGATGVGGVAQLVGGAGGSSSGDGGDAHVLGGASTGSRGGKVLITAANSIGANNGGVVTITAGDGGATGTGGSVRMYGGSGGATSGNGGAAHLYGGTAPNGSAGNVGVTGGAGTAANSGGLASMAGGAGGATGDGGAITITAGAGGGTSGDGGDVTLTAGTETSGTPGKIVMVVDGATAMEIQDTSQLVYTGNFIGTVATFANDGSNVNREGVEIQCGEDAPIGVNVFVRFQDGNGSDAGGIDRTGTGTAAFFAASDERLKKDIAPSKLDTLKIINELEPVEFRRSHSMGVTGDRNSNGSEKVIKRKLDNQPLTPIGFIAQQAQEAFPDMVSEDRKYGMLKINEAALIPVLVGAIKELTKRLELLESA